MDAETVLRNVSAVAAEFAADRRERQQRRHLDPDDFKKLADAGYLLTGVPADMGGLWVDLRKSVRAYAEILRTLARGDASVALVSAMHPAVLNLWLGNRGTTPAFEEQKRLVCQTALDGHWWGTVTSEPGSGGDITMTRATASRAEDGAYRLFGQKHFGSGSGVTSYMVTSAIPEGGERGEVFFLDVRGAAWDGSAGMKLVAPWDGHGMIATQSHAFEFTGYPATLVPPRELPGFGDAGALGLVLFTAVIVGVVQEAVATARRQVTRKKAQLRPYELVEWARIEQEAWLIDQAYEGMLRATEALGTGASLDSMLAKVSIAELAESVTGLVCRVVGGGSFSQSSPYGAAFEDVRALGFLRPPWGLAYDQMLTEIWARSPAGA
ncbi:MAG TPA: acyl-CoA dehydrogenase family protein [Dehalococcoidia bacterium]|nr:acyl-CoA dehydrogenase family protein [Dehalococcoidia bacterium]